MSEVCSDNHFELIEKAKAMLVDATNIEMCSDEMAVVDSILFRCWQMGWLDQLRMDEIETIDSRVERTCHIEYPYYGDAPVINGQPRCSECKTEFAVGTFPNYCPNCGAKVVS